MKSTNYKTAVWVKSKLTLIKSMVAGCGLLLLPCAQAQFTWPIYEPFSQYTNIPANMRLGGGDSALNWNFGNGTSSANFLITNGAAMSYAALLPDPTNSNPKGIQEVPSGSNGSGDRGVIFSPQTGTWYTSFLLNYQSNGGQTEDRLVYNVVTGAAAGSFTRAYTAVWLTGDYRLKVTKNYNEANSLLTAKFSAATPVLATNVTHLIVMRYLKVPGGQDKVDLWVDPAPFGDEANIPPPTVSTTNGANIASFNGVLLNHRKVNGAAQNTFSIFKVDEIRFASTWSGVTPLATPAPGPMFTMTGGGVGCPSDSINVGLSGSVTTNDYLLYTNGVYTGNTLTGTGAALDFGAQTTPTLYSVLASNNVTAEMGWMSNKVSVYVRAAISVVQEPAPVLCATNNRAQFKVGITGDEPQFGWYKVGNPSPLANGGNVSGADTATLVVWPATAADIGDYYCVITNICGSAATSTTNSLTLQAASDLVWTGNTFLNLWDVGNSTYNYFTDINAAAAVFNPGDNVTFNDSATTPDTVILTNVLTPTSLTVDANRNYIFSSVGVLAGNFVLVKSGAGVLTINNNAANNGANAYTGGTIISNGVINMTNSWYGLGSGPVTLAGGTLANWQKGNAGGPGVEQGLTNDLVMLANSTWQVDRTGDQAAALLGKFTVNPGLTLTVYYSATTHNSANRFRIGSVFTNDLNIVGTANPVATNSPADFGAYNSTGAQVYNGVISGTNTGFHVAGGGQVYLNGANTYTRDTINSSGFLAGSGSINGQLVISNAATLGAGSPTAIGTFTVNSNVFLNGNVRIRVDKSLAQSNDLVSVTGVIANGGTGTVTITNLGASTLVAGDSFKIFSGAVNNGGALTITGGGAGWVNKLAIDGTIQVVPGYSTNISHSFSGNTLSLSWPATHLGWILQSQTNSLNVGLGNIWYDVPGTANVTSTNMTVNPENPAVFYRLRHP